MQSNLTNNTPGISVVIPVQENSIFLRETLESIVNQAYSVKEIQIIDDCESLNKNIVYDINTKIPINYYILNQSVSYKRNLGISKSISKWVAFCDADDVWYPNKLEKQVNIINSDPKCVLVCGAANRINSNSEPISKARRQQIGYSGIVTEKLLLRNFVITSTVLANKDAISNAGYFRPIGEAVGRDNLQDWDLWLRLSLEGATHFIREPLIKYRVHTEQSTFKLTPQQREYIVNFMIDDLEKNAKASHIHISFFNEARANMYLQLCYWYLRARNKNQAKSSLAKSVKFNQDIKKTWIYRILKLISVLPELIQQLIPYNSIHRKI
jgi:glycosyltransferase involved in cell wall biosynthesis